MTSEYRYGFFTAGQGKPHGRRMTLAERLRLRKRRKKTPDLWNLKEGW